MGKKDQKEQQPEEAEMSSNSGGSRNTDCSIYRSPELLLRSEGECLAAGAEMDRISVQRTNMVFPLGWCSSEEHKQTWSCLQGMKILERQESLALTSEQLGYVAESSSNWQRLQELFVSDPDEGLAGSWISQGPKASVSVGQGFHGVISTPVVGPAGHRSREHVTIVK